MITNIPVYKTDLHQGNEDNRVNKNQRHTTNEKTRNQICKKIYVMITNIPVCKTDLFQGNTN